MELLGVNHGFDDAKRLSPVPDSCLQRIAVVRAFSVVERRTEGIDQLLIGEIARHVDHEVLGKVIVSWLLTVVELDHQGSSISIRCTHRFKAGLQNYHKVSDPPNLLSLPG